MRRLRGFIVALATATLILGMSVLLLGADDGDGPYLPGVTQVDDHPNGCVDCHRQVSAESDYRLNVSLKEMEGHPDISRMVKTMPKDCAMCHKAGASAGLLSNVVHEAHYEDPAENHFVSSYQGACLSCHTLNLSDGSMTMKSGAKNW